MRTIVIATALIALASCTGFKSKKEVEALNEAQVVGSPFTQQLATEYRDMANQEQNKMFDYPDALHFARKGLASARGDVVMPEPVSDWNLNASDLADLAQGRARLVAALDAGAREIAPKEAAMAQGRFDCWIEQQEERWNDKNIPCKNAFMDIMSGLEGIVGSMAPSNVMEPVTDMGIQPTEPLKKEDAVFLVFFDFDGDTLNEGAMNVVNAVVPEITKQTNLKAVNVTGFADTSGPDGYNMKLSMRRASAVRDALVAQGVPADIIRVDHKGETELMVPTPDGVREPANRRATITFE